MSATSVPSSPITLAPVHWRRLSAGQLSTAEPSLHWGTGPAVLQHETKQIQAPSKRRVDRKKGSSGGRVGKLIKSSKHRIDELRAIRSRSIDLEITMNFAKQNLIDSVANVKMFGPRHISNAMTLGAVFGLCALVAFSLPFVLGMPFVEMLFAHGCAGALGGIAALFGDAALSASLDKPRLPYWRWREDTCIATWLQGCVRRMKINLREHCFARTVALRSINAMTFVFIKHVATLYLGAGVQTVVIAAAGTGVVATAVEVLCKQQDTLFQETVVNNMLMFEGFWVTYAALSTLLPVCGITYFGLFISGALGGLGMALADVSSQSESPRVGLREGLQRFRDNLSEFSKRDAINGKKFRAAYQMAILNVVYMAVFWTLSG